jgi:hypothetical protein
MVLVNPIESIEYLKENDSKKIRAMTSQEARKLLEEANGWFRPVLLTAVYTGMLPKNCTN